MTAEGGNSTADVSSELLEMDFAAYGVFELATSPGLPKTGFPLHEDVEGIGRKLADVCLSDPI